MTIIVLADHRRVLRVQHRDRVYYKARAGKSTTEFFLSGPTSLVARGHIDGRDVVFAATPRSGYRFCGNEGIAGTWIWWVLPCERDAQVFFYARLCADTR